MTYGSIPSENRGFVVASYNVLATAYIQPGRYPRTPALILHPTWRIPALVQHIVSLEADVLCLQEVERETFATLRARLGPAGYAAHYAQKRGGRPDGCATFYRKAFFTAPEVHVLAYGDGRSATADAGHIALIVLLRASDRLLGIANTHLAWDPPETPREAQRGYRQISQLLEAYASLATACQGWLLCGDLNVVPGSAVLAALAQAGFRYTHAGLGQAYTCNPNGQAKMIDYLCHTAHFRAEPQVGVDVHDHTPLPSAEQPSDHVPVVARFFWDAGAALPGRSSCT